MAPQWMLSCVWQLHCVAPVILIPLIMYGVWFSNLIDYYTNLCNLLCNVENGKIAEDPYMAI